MSAISKILCRGAFAPVVLALIGQQTLAATYPVEITRKLHGLKIFERVTTIEVGNSSVLSLTNASTEKASCRVTFDPRIEQRKTASRKIEPGETVTVHYAAGRQINRLNITINCKPI